MLGVSFARAVGGLVVFCFGCLFGCVYNIVCSGISETTQDNENNNDPPRDFCTAPLVIPAELVAALEFPRARGVQDIGFGGDLCWKWSERSGQFNNSYGGLVEQCLARRTHQHQTELSRRSGKMVKGTGGR